MRLGVTNAANDVTVFADGHGVGSQTLARAPPRVSRIFCPRKLLREHPPHSGDLALIAPGARQPQAFDAGGRPLVGGGAALLLRGASAYNNGYGLKPFLGWQSWCAVGKCGTDACYDRQIRQTAKAMATNGMKELGFEWVVIDDWCGRTPAAPPPLPLREQTSTRSNRRLLGAAGTRPARRTAR